MNSNLNGTETLRNLQLFLIRIYYQKRMVVKKQSLPKKTILWQQKNFSQIDFKDFTNSMKLIKTETTFWMFPSRNKIKVLFNTKMDLLEKAISKNILTIGSFSFIVILASIFGTLLRIL